MNPMQHMKDPAAGLAPLLLPHMHLISKYRYPVTNNPSLETIVGYLLEAPKIVRDLQPVQWQYLDGPPDGTLMLVWQPLEYLGTNFASDGYIYGDAEQIFKSEVRGYTLEMFLQRSGYRVQGEPVASHSRRRYRLLPGNPGLPNPDQSLFLIHYSKASQRDHIPAASIPVLPHVHTQIQQRRAIQSQGQLGRKEFMLHDRSNWPTIAVPQGVARQAQPGPMAQAGHRRGPSIASNEATLEEEEDVSRGDVLDFMTPRDISRVRYEQHHEWLEEIVDTPYNIFQIVPGDLGLGRKGELEDLTKDFFHAPTSAMREPASDGEIPKVGRLAPGKAEEFAKRASEKIADMNAELEKMRQKHARRMEKLQRTTLLNTAERRLRTVPNTTSGRNISPDLVVDQTNADPIDKIASEVEGSLGKKIEQVTTVKCISRGGLEDRYSTSALTNGNAGNSTTSPVKGEAPSIASENAVHDNPLQGQSPDVAQPESQSESTGKPTAEDSEGQSTPANGLNLGDETENNDMTIGSGEDNDQQETDLPSLDNIGVDVDMSGLVDDDEQAETNNAEGNEWVMVEDQNEELPGEVDEAGIADGTQQQPEAEAQGEVGQKHVNTTQPAPNDESTQQDQQDQQDQEENNIDSTEFDMGADFDDVDVDTAGDALASYGDDDDLNLDDMDGSAFGDAFHQDDHDLS